jgi:hypothetical protein
MRSIRRPSAPLVVSFVAMFVALGGSSYAAAKITGKEIAKKTITGSNVKNETLGGKKVKPDSLGGDQIDESLLGTVPSAAHATAADTATNAAKAADADTLDGIDSAALMLVKPRAFEASVGAINNFGDNAVLATIHDLAAGTYVVQAKLTYDNDGGGAEAESCTLNVPGANDVTEFVVENTEMVTLQEVVISGTSFSPEVSCTSDGNDDTLGTLSLIASRVD